MSRKPKNQQKKNKEQIGIPRSQGSWELPDHELLGSRHSWVHGSPVQGSWAAGIRGSRDPGIAYNPWFQPSVSVIFVLICLFFVAGVFYCFNLR